MKTSSKSSNAGLQDGRKKRRKSSTPAKTTRKRRSGRRRSSGLHDGLMSPRADIGHTAMTFVEAGAGAFLGSFLLRMLPIQNQFMKTAAGAAAAVFTARTFKRPALGYGMAAVVAVDAGKAFGVPGLNDAFEPAEFMNDTAPSMVYVDQNGVPVFLQDDGTFLYADGEDAYLSLADYEEVY